MTPPSRKRAKREAVVRWTYLWRYDDADIWRGSLMWRRKCDAVRARASDIREEMLKTAQFGPVVRFDLPLPLPRRAKGAKR